MARFAPAALFAAILAALPALVLPPGSARAQEAGSGAIQDMTLGEPDAPVEVIEYASFTCPHCADFHENVFPDLKRDYIDTGKVRFIHREVYFDRFGLWASMVARCGGEMRYFGIADRIYETQSEWTSGGEPAAIAERLRRIGRAAGLSQEKLETCLSDADRAEALVAWYRENAERHQVEATPTLIIDGEEYSNMPYSELADTIDAKLPAEG